MKKFLVLLLVLGMASSASAILQISVHSPTGGETWDPLNPQDSQITIEPSDTLILDIYTDTGLSGLPAIDQLSLQLVCETALGTIGYNDQIGASTANNDGDWLDPPQTALNASVISPEGMEGLAGLALAFGGADAGAVLYDEILFHCEGEGDVHIQLWDAPDGGAPQTMYDEVVIHQVPEPMTVGLLGLGGLFLLRRRK